MDIKEALWALKSRRPDGLQVLAMISGISEKRLDEIAIGKGEPITPQEKIMLEMLR